MPREKHELRVVAANRETYSGLSDDEWQAIRKDIEFGRVFPAFCVEIDMNTKDVDTCPRCGAKHAGMVFSRFGTTPEIEETFGQPRRFELWALCPATGEPILSEHDDGKFRKFEAI